MTVDAELDASAIRIVGMVEKLVDSVAEHIRASPQQFPHLDFADSDAVWADLVVGGFAERGAFFPKAWLDKPAEEQSVAHYGLSADSTILANFGTLKKHNVHVVILSSRLSDGRSITTLNGIDSGVPTPPHNTAYRFPRETPVEELIAAHHSVLDPVKGELMPFTSLDEGVAWIDQRSADTHRFRVGLGMSVFPELFARKFEGERVEAGQVLLRRIMAHPEWYKYSLSHH